MKSLTTVFILVLASLAVTVPAAAVATSGSKLWLDPPPANAVAAGRQFEPVGPLRAEPDGAGLGGVTQTTASRGPLRREPDSAGLRTDLPVFTVLTPRGHGFGWGALAVGISLGLGAGVIGRGAVALRSRRDRSHMTAVPGVS